MKFSVLTLFPECVQSAVQTSITGRALKAGLFHFETIDIRAYAQNRYGKIDDALYGGGRGMLMMAHPVYQAWQAARQQTLGKDLRQKTIYLSPKGAVFNQSMAKTLATYDHLVLLCGHYEGVDQRVLDAIEAQEVSIGDYVLTGGELGAAVLMDAIIRLLPGVLPESAAYEIESHYQAGLECCHYTKPAVWENREVPSVLQSGHHERIKRYQQLDGWLETWQKRPDLFADIELNEADYLDLIQMARARFEVD